MTSATRKGLPSYGGQAVIEGVMMRGTRACAVAVRAPDRSILVDVQPLASAYRSQWARLPLVRGLFILWDSLALGMRAMTFSANAQIVDGPKIDGRAMAGTFAVSLVIALALFLFLPTALGIAVERTLSVSSWWGNLAEGLMRLVMIVGYIAAVGRLPDVRRVFAYHGAEHKTINAFEAGASLDPGAVSTFPREHARCGTAFLLTVVVLSVVVFSLLGPLPLLPRIVSRILLVPLLAALAYEYIRLTSRFSSRRWARPLLAPNLAMQALTTREPATDMIEVALAAFHAMQRAELANPG